MSKRGFVYILTNKNNKVLYTGVTSELVGRVQKHNDGTGSVFTAKYKVNKLVYYEVSDDMLSAIEREKQIKSWKRKRKLELIEKFNPDWKNLSLEI